MFIKIALIATLCPALMAGIPKLSICKNELRIIGTDNKVVLTLLPEEADGLKYYSVSKISSNRYTIYIWKVKSYRTDIDSVSRIDLTGRSIDFIDKQEYGASTENSFQVGLYGAIQYKNDRVLIEMREVIGISKIMGKQVAVLNTILVE